MFENLSSKTPCLFNFRRVKFHYVKETHMMLVSFWRWRKLMQLASQHTEDNERNLCKDLLTIEHTGSDRLRFESVRPALGK